MAQDKCICDPTEVVLTIVTTGEKIYPSGTNIVIEAINDPPKWEKHEKDGSNQFWLKQSYEDDKYHLGPDGNNTLILYEDPYENDKGVFHSVHTATGKHLVQNVNSSLYIGVNKGKMTLVSSDEATEIKISS